MEQPGSQDPKAAGGRCLRLAWLDMTPERLSSAHYARARTESRLAGLRSLCLKGWRIRVTFLDPTPFPWNPLRGFHSLYAGLDPLRSARLLAAERNYDGIVAVGESSSLIYLWVRDLVGKGKPVCLYDPPLDYGWKPRAVVLDQVLGRCRAVLVRGNNQKDFLLDRYGKRLQVEVVWHAIDTEFWKPGQVTPGNYIFSIGNDPGRDFETLLKAVEGLNVQVIIKTSDHRLPGVETMPNVSVIRERISFDELRSLYNHARLVVLPLKETVHAGGVNSLLEAMSMGKPVIVSGSSGIADYYRAGRDAEEVPVGDAKKLRSAIVDLLQDATRARELGCRARCRMVEKFSRPVFERRLFEALLRIFACSTAGTW
ncbi:MAG: glycosyltransferase family 4 protein [Desulfosoma sp.]|uniref:glycosyltransferase family 4 protein n=1 Tax=Desulfosoma sp. TaxID=2603217 RepID=UPI00404B5E11